MPLHSLIDNTAIQQNEYVRSGESITYNQAAAATRRLAAWLASLGCGVGDRVLIISSNRPEAVLLAYASSRLGAIFSIVNSEIKPYGLERIVEQCQPKVLVGDVGHSWVEVRTAMGQDEVDWPEHQGSDDEPVCLVYTSGSTGQSRGVTLTHGNILFVIAAIQERLDYRPNDVIGLVLPLSFDYGLYQFFLAAQIGAAVAVGAGSTELVGFLRENKVTVLPGLPSLFANLMRLLSRRLQSLPHLRLLTNTGEHLSPAYLDQLRQLLPGICIFLMYGLTECKRVSILLPSEIETKPGSVGRPLYGTEAFIDNGSGKPAPPNTIGELIVRGPHVALGYWNAPRESAMRFRNAADGIRELHTGDLFRADSEGYLYFEGRQDAQMKHKGYRISPLEIEDAACAVPGVRQAGAVKDRENGELCLYVVSRNPDVSARQVFDALHERLESFKLPDCICFCDSLPTTINGKLDRTRLAGRPAKGKHDQL